MLLFMTSVHSKYAIGAIKPTTQPTEISAPSPCCDNVHWMPPRLLLAAMCLDASNKRGIHGKPRPLVDMLDDLVLQPGKVLYILCTAVPRHHTAQTIIMNHLEAHAIDKTAHKAFHLLVTFQPGDLLVTFLSQRS